MEKKHIRGGNCRIVEMEGMSMYNEYDQGKSIHDGDLLLIYPNIFNDLKSGDVVQAQCSESLTDIRIRVYDKDGDNELLIPLNNTHPVIPVTSKVKILGIVSMSINYKTFKSFAED